jgi:hypothetical protein
VREGTRVIADERCLEVESADAAEYGAARAAGEIGRDQLPKGDARDVTVEVRDERGQQVVTVRVAMEVYRTEPVHLWGLCCINFVRHKP